MRTTYRSTESSDSIPALLGRETSGVAAVAGTDGHVGESLVRLLVNPRVEETEGLLALGEQGIVDESNDGGEVRAGSGSAADGPDDAGPDDNVVVALGGDVGVRAAGLVVEAVVLALQALDVLVDGLLLVLGGGEVVAETCAGGEARDGGFGGEVGGAADGGDPGAGGRERRAELVLVRAVVGVASAVSANTVVTGRHHVGDTAGTELGESVADALGVRVGDGLLVVTVRAADHPREVVLGKGVVEEGQVGLVGVGGGAETGLEWGHATSVESLHLGRPADTEHKLCVEVALNVLLLFLHLGDVGALVVGSVVDDLELELVGCLCGLRTEGLEELGSVVSAAGLTCYLLVSNLIVRVMTKRAYQGSC